MDNYDPIIDVDASAGDVTTGNAVDMSISDDYTQLEDDVAAVTNVEFLLAEYISKPKKGRLGINLEGLYMKTNKHNRSVLDGLIGGYPIFSKCEDLNGGELDRMIYYSSSYGEGIEENVWIFARNASSGWSLRSRRLEGEWLSEFAPEDSLRVKILDKVPIIDKLPTSDYSRRISSQYIIESPYHIDLLRRMSLSTEKRISGALPPLSDEKVQRNVIKLSPMTEIPYHATLKLGNATLQHAPIDQDGHHSLRLELLILSSAHEPIYLRRYTGAPDLKVLILATKNENRMITLNRVELSILQSEYNSTSFILLEFFEDEESREIAEADGS